MISHVDAGAGPPGTIRAAIFAGALVVSACFGAALTFSDQPAEAAEARHGSLVQPG